MKSGKLGKMMGKDPDTIINWTKRPEVSKFFSPSAMITRGQREFNDKDVQIINSIRQWLSEGVAWEDIATRLEAGERVLEFPVSAAGVEGITPVEVYGQGVASATQLKEAQTRIRDLEGKLDELQEKRLEDQRRMLGEREDLLVKIGRLERELEMYKEALRKQKAGDGSGPN
jgi:DNA-binding transcriptional MerR regulator